MAQEILKINPTYGDVYRTAGDHLARQYRFDEAVVMTRRALDHRSEATHGRMADLGLQLMRAGDEAAARTSLEASFEGDQFQSNLLTKNLLDVLDELENDFETITDGRIVMKLHKSEVGVMREHALPLAKEALARSRSATTSPRRARCSSRCFRSTTTSRSARSACPA